eukprot:TRINITY_DN545_c0_g5_i1.p1 TRINITY_DN545_c0_g5~~TRINITY_DN545_c0_g5_i1.p1  ORF type:complete len:119 (+),score=27.18 TRINITY_DN545_c0_g5_i1:123-479(+)
MATRGVWQLKQLLIKFCDFGGSSRGARDFISKHLEEFKAANPQLTAEAVLNRGHHPHLQAVFENGSQRIVDLRKKSLGEVYEQVERLRDSTGRKVKKLTTRHVTERPSIQGTWRPGMF